MAVDATDGRDGDAAAGTDGATDTADGSERGDADVAGDDGGPRPPLLSPRTKATVLWAVVGGLAFLVLIQGYELLAAERVTLGVKFGVAALVAIAAGATTRLARRQLPVEE